MTAYGPDGGSPERRIHLSTQVTDVDLNDVGVPGVPLSPHVVQNLFLGAGSAGVAHEVLEHGELAWRQLDGSLAVTKRAPAWVKDEVSDYDIGRPPSGSSPRQRATAGHEDVVRERLAQVVVGPEVEYVGLDRLAVTRREDQDRGPDAFGPQARAYLLAGEDGKHEIKDDDVDLLLLGQSVPRLSVVAEDHAEATRFKALGQRACEPHLVLDDQDPHSAIMSYRPLLGGPLGQSGKGRLPGAVSRQISAIQAPLAALLDGLGVARSRRLSTTTPCGRGGPRGPPLLRFSCAIQLLWSSRLLSSHDVGHSRRTVADTVGREHLELPAGVVLRCGEDEVPGRDPGPDRRNDNGHTCRVVRRVHLDGLHGVARNRRTTVVGNPCHEVPVGRGRDLSARITGSGVPEYRSIRSRGRGHVRRGSRGSASSDDVDRADPEVVDLAVRQTRDHRVGGGAAGPLGRGRARGDVADRHQVISDGRSVCDSRTPVEAHLTVAADCCRRPGLARHSGCDDRVGLRERTRTEVVQSPDSERVRPTWDQTRHDPAHGTERERDGGRGQTRRLHLELEAVGGCRQGVPGHRGGAPGGRRVAGDRLEVGRSGRRCNREVGELGAYSCRVPSGAEPQVLDVAHRVDAIADLLPDDVRTGLGDRDVVAVRRPDDRVVRLRTGEDDRVDVPRRRGRADDLPNRDDVARVDGSGEHRLLERRTGESTGRRTQVLLGHRALPHLVHRGATDLACRVSRVGANAEPDVEVLVAVDDVVGSATLDQVAAAPAEEDVASPPDGTAQDRAVIRRRERDDAREGRGQRWDQRVETVDPFQACLVQHVTADEAAAAHLCRDDVVSAEDVVQVTAGERLDLVELVAHAHRQDVEGDEPDREVHVGPLWVADPDLPVVPGGSGDLFDAGTADTDVVAALHVVVVVAALADQDVRARRLRVVQEEQVAAVSLHEVRLVAALLVVVAAVTERGVEALAEHDEVVTVTTEGLVGVGPTVGEVLALATHDDVQARAGVDRVFAGTALGDVVSVEVGDDFVADAAQCHVGPVAALQLVVAQPTPEGVAVVAAGHPVDARGAVVDALAVDTGRVDGVAV